MADTTEINLHWEGCKKKIKIADSTFVQVNIKI